MFVRFELYALNPLTSHEKKSVLALMRKCTHKGLNQKSI